MTDDSNSHLNGQQKMLVADVVRAPFKSPANRQVFIGLLLEGSDGRRRNVWGTCSTAVRHMGRTSELPARLYKKLGSVGVRHGQRTCMYVLKNSRNISVCGHADVHVAVACEEFHMGGKEVAW